MSTTDTNQQVADVLAEALALMNDNGAHWWQGWLHGPNGQFCALGAIKEKTGGAWTADRDAPPVRQEAIAALAGVLPEPLVDDFAPDSLQFLMQTITYWNDDHDRVWPDIVAKFQEAREKLLGRSA